MNLPAGWYIVAERHELNPKTLNPLRRFGHDWIAWKNSSGEWNFQKDSCPHRSARLSLGAIENDCVVCPFHGFRFDSSGRCAHAPEIKKGAPGLRVESHKLTLFQDFFWVNLGVPVEKPIPWFDDLPPTCAGSRYQVNWQQHFSRCVENQLDHSHVPFVHRTTIGRGLTPGKPARTEVTEDGIRILTSWAPDPEHDIIFRFPGVWRLKVAPNFMPFLAFVPIDEENTRFYMRTYQGFVTNRFLAPIVGYMNDVANRFILKQDFRVVIDQRPKNVLAAKNEHLFPGDAAIRAFRRWLASGEPGPAVEWTQFADDGLKQI